MRHALVSRGVTLGHTGAELSGLLPNSRAWHFLPTVDFEPVRQALGQFQQDTVALEEVMPTDDTLATMREDERAAFVRHAIEGEPGAERLLTSAGLIDALALELHDDTGAVLETRTLGVTELALEPAAFREVLAALEPGADPALSDTPPFFLLVAGF